MVNMDVITKMKECDGWGKKTLNISIGHSFQKYFSGSSLVLENDMQSSRVNIERSWIHRNGSSKELYVPNMDHTFGGDL